MHGYQHISQEYSYRGKPIKGNPLKCKFRTVNFNAWTNIVAYIGLHTHAKYLELKTYLKLGA